MAGSYGRSLRGLSLKINIHVQKGFLSVKETALLPASGQSRAARCWIARQ